MNRAIPPLAVIEFALAANAQDGGAPIPWEQDDPSPDYWEFFVFGGPFFFGLNLSTGLHLLMLVSFVASVALTVRSIRPHLLPYLFLAPCFCSSAVVWLAVFSLRIRFQGQFEGNIYGIAAGFSRPLVLGSALSAIAVIFHHVFSMAHKSATPPGAVANAPERAGFSCSRCGESSLSFAPSGAFPISYATRAN